MVAKKLGTLQAPGLISLAALPIEDFRRRTARERRQRTSIRLIEAVFSITDEGRLPRISVDDVRVTAGLSRGAFYRYYPTLDALLAHVSGAIGAQINAEMSACFDNVSDPALRLSLHLRYLIRRATSDPACAMILARTLPLTGAVSDFARDHAARDFEQAVAAGQFDLPSLPVAVDLAHGMAATMLRRAVLDGYDEQRVALETAMLLRGCGMRGNRATRLVAKSLPEPPASNLRTAVLAISRAN